MKKSIITIYIYIDIRTVVHQQSVSLCVCVYACIVFGSFPFNSAPFQHYDCWFDVAVAFFNIPYQYIHCNCCSPNEPTGSTHTKMANHRTKWMRMDIKLYKQSKWSICVQSTHLSVWIPILIKISNFFSPRFHSNAKIMAYDVMCMAWDVGVVSLSLLAIIDAQIWTIEMTKTSRSNLVSNQIICCQHCNISKIPNYDRKVKSACAIEMCMCWNDFTSIRTYIMIINFFSPFIN